MKKIIQTSVIAIILLTLFSFVPRITELDFTGSYGVADNDPARIELILNSDNTFIYKDLSNSAKQINVKGNWKMKNNKIFLISPNSEFSFHTKWKISKDGLVAKSRKGITFYTLTKK